MKFLLVLSAALAAAYGEASEPRAQLRPIMTYYQTGDFGPPTFLLPTNIIQQPLYALGVPLGYPKHISKAYTLKGGTHNLRPPVKGVVRGPQSGQPTKTVPEQGTETIIGQLAPTEQGTLSPETIISQVAPAGCPWCRVGGGAIKGVVRGAGGAITLVGPKDGPRLSGGERFPATTDDFQAWESRPSPQDSFGKLTEQSNKKGVVRGIIPLSPSPPQTRPEVVQSVPMVPTTSTVCLNYMGAAVHCANGMPMPFDPPSRTGVVRGTQDEAIKTPARPLDEAIKTQARPLDEAIKTQARPLDEAAIITGDLGQPDYETIYSR